jgi:hypothetical protein
MTRTRERAFDADSRLLRRIDWRFFLTSVPDRAVCAADADLTAAVELMSPDVCPLADDVPPADLVVLSDPTARVLQCAHAALAAGGACYVEWRPTLLGHRRRRARLRAADLEPVQTYWAWPPPTRRSPQFWLPHEGDAAISHFLSTRATARTLARRTLRRASRTAWRVGRRVGLLGPTCTIARRSCDGEHRTSLEAELTRRWVNWGLGPEPDSLSCIMLTGGHSRLNKVVILVFADNDSAPRLAIKLARVPQAERALVREAEALRRVAAGSVRALADVPKVVFCEPLAGTFAVGETPMLGTPVTSILSRETHRNLALQVTEALAAMASANESVTPPTYWERIVQPALDDFQTRFGNLIEHDAVDETRQALANLPVLPSTTEHRDCSPWNVLLSGSGRLALLDWESAEPAGLPLLDLVYYLTNATLFVDGTLASGRERATYAQMLQPTTRSGRVFSEAVHLYCASTAVDPRVVPVLRRFGWMLHAPGEHDRIMALQPEASSDDAASQAVSLSLWLEDVSQGDLTT